MLHLMSFTMAPGPTWQSWPAPSCPSCSRNEPLLWRCTTSTDVFRCGFTPACQSPKDTTCSRRSQSSSLQWNVFHGMAWILGRSHLHCEPVPNWLAHSGEHTAAARRLIWLSASSRCSSEAAGMAEWHASTSADPMQPGHARASACCIGPCSDCTVAALTVPSSMHFIPRCPGHSRQGHACACLRVARPATGLLHRHHHAVHSVASQVIRGRGTHVPV